MRGGRIGVGLGWVGAGEGRSSSGVGDDPGLWYWGHGEVR